MTCPQCDNKSETSGRTLAKGAYMVCPSCLNLLIYEDRKLRLANGEERQAIMAGSLGREIANYIAKVTVARGISWNMAQEGMKEAANMRSAVDSHRSKLLETQSEEIPRTSQLSIAE